MAEAVPRPSSACVDFGAYCSNDAVGHAVVHAPPERMRYLQNLVEHCNCLLILARVDVLDTLPSRRLVPAAKMKRTSAWRYYLFKR
jgi:hypothetical protein